MKDTKRRMFSRGLANWSVMMGEDGLELPTRRMASLEYAMRERPLYNFG